MRRVVLFTLTSLDGAVDDPLRYFPTDTDGPSAPAYDEAMLAQEAKLIASQDIVLLGRGMYDEWAVTTSGGALWLTYRPTGLRQ